MWTSVPAVPVMVIVYVPAGVVEAVEIVSADVKLGVPDGGVKVAVAPVGRPEAVRLTVLLKPPTEASETVAAAVDPPWTADPESGLTLMVKSGGTAPTAKTDRPGEMAEK